jgi:hypothetical protein
MSSRSAQYQQQPCKPSERLRHVESSCGLFHLQIAGLTQLWRTHIGADTDAFSLTTWTKHLQKSSNRMWNSQKQMVKDYRATLDFISIVLDGYILAVISSIMSSQIKSSNELADFLRELLRVDKKASSLQKNEKRAECVTKLRLVVENAAACLEDFGKVKRSRTNEESKRDKSHESTLLFIQQALVLRNLEIACKDGDSGRATNSLAFITQWFQGTEQYNYANETMHLTACLRLLWSERLRKFWMENCLVNISGRRGNFVPLDMLNEYVVREVGLNIVYF